jgi:hypothetical protein
LLHNIFVILKIVGGELNGLEHQKTSWSLPEQSTKKVMMMDVFGQQGATEMKLYRYKKDGNLYKLYEQKMPYYELQAVPYFPNQGILAKSKRSISMNDFEVVAER